MAQLASGIFCLWKIAGMEQIRLSKEDVRDWKKWSLSLLKLGFPMAFQNGIIAVGGMIVQSVVNSFGVTFIAGFTATNKLYGILEIAATSYGYAIVTYVGQNWGAGKTDRIKQGMKNALLVALATSLVIGSIMIILGKFILSGFISSPDPAQAAAALDISYFYLVIMSVFLPTLYLLYVLRSTIQGLGNTFLPMLSGVGEFVMRTGAALILPLFLAETGIFFAEVAAWMGADVILIISYFYIRGKFFTK